MRQDSPDSAAVSEFSEDFGIRKVISERSFLGSTDIGAIKLDAKSRDGIPALLIGLQAIYMNEEARTEVSM